MLGWLWIRGIKAAQGPRTSSLGPGIVPVRKTRNKRETSCKRDFRLLCSKLAAQVMFLEIAVSPESLWGLAGAVVVLRSLSAPTSHKGGKNYIFFFFKFFFLHILLFTRSGYLETTRKPGLLRLSQACIKNCWDLVWGFFFFFS